MTSRLEHDPPIRVETIHNAHAARIIIIGEADIANLENLKAALASIELDGARAVQLQVSELAFVDVSALRVLTAFAGQLRRAGRDVTTSGARPVVERAMRILRVDDVLGLS